VPPAAQDGLKETLAVSGYALACQFTPTGAVALEPGDADEAVPATLRAREPLAADVFRLVLEPEQRLDIRPGQFVNLAARGAIRSYSVASPPGSRALELHVKRVAGGAMTGYLTGELAPGESVELRGPRGSSFYVEGRPQQPLVLVGTGTGLAPILGVVRDALASGHRGPIRLYHGSRDPGGLYLHDELARLAAAHPQVSYHPCLSGRSVPAGCRAGRASALMLADHPELSGCRVFLAGRPDMVRETRKRAFLAGADLADIHADPFVAAR
jgi:NAD(P)H-flavin reductase